MFAKLGVALKAAGYTTIVNDPTVPRTMSFSDASTGTCTLFNTRASYTMNVPVTQNVWHVLGTLNYD